MYLPEKSLLQGGKYRIVRFISSGGFGNTYEGVHTMLDTHVAIKEFFVKDFCNRDEQTYHVTVGTQSKVELVQKLRNKFVDEAKALYKMQHPNIVRVLDIFEENGTAYYVMDYIDGQSLHEILRKRGSLPENEVLEYVKHIANALKYVHCQNRLHLDIKPGNIMVDNQGVVKLIDFGASKQYDEVGGENTSTLFGKTPGYAPIEQMGNTVRTFTPATDIYALGATMYKCLTGSTPPDATLLASGEVIPPLPHVIADKVCNAVYQSMQTNKMKRPQSIDEFMALLNHASNAVCNNSVENSEEVTVLDINPDSQSKKIYDNTDSKDLSFDIKGVKFKMLRVEGGTFDMKETVSSGFLGLSTKEIIQKTTLSDYYIGKTEVTQALWKAVMGNNPSTFKGDNLPVESVSWNDCQKFISKLNSMTGLDFRLPTEAEWEFAARGGNRSNHYQYSGSDNLDDVAWYGSNSGGETHAVATKNPNELGLYDMSGNVREWCSDWYGGYSSSSQSNPKGPSSSGSYRVNRGGSWGNDAGGCRSSYRIDNTPVNSVSNLGLRLVLVP